MTATANPKTKQGGADEGAFLVNESAREVYLVGDVGPEMARTVVLAMRCLEQGPENVALAQPWKPGPVNVILASNGGCVDSAWVIYEAVRLASYPVAITCVGSCQSAATLILQAGDRRILSPECRFMIHNGSTAVESDTGQLGATLNEIELLIQKYYKMLSKRSGLSMAKVKALCDKSTYLSAEEAVSFGFADEVLQYPNKTGKKGKK